MRSVLELVRVAPFVAVVTSTYCHGRSAQKVDELSLVVT